MPVVTTVTSWGEAMLTSFAGALALLFAAIPKIIGFALILFVGWILASLAYKAIAALLRHLHFDGFSNRIGLSDLIVRMGVRKDASGFVAELFKWFIRLVAIVVAFDALGLPAISEVVQRMLLWLPNLVVALAVLVIGGIAANAAANFVRGTTGKAGFANPDLVARIAAVAVWVFAIIIAVNQIGVAETLVNTLFTAFVGAAALAAGLAFGLGGRDTAAEIWRNWYARARASAPKLRRAGDIAANEPATPLAHPLRRREDPRPATGD
jgi:mechanosensitive ion channel-like protein